MTTEQKAIVERIYLHATEMNQAIRQGASMGIRTEIHSIDVTEIGTQRHDRALVETYLSMSASPEEGEA